MNPYTWRLCLLLCCSNALAQTQSAWQTLPNAPVTSRHNDVYFVTPALGWIANGAGEIYHTHDGGLSWQLQLRHNGTHFRSLGFLDARRGWAGNVGVGEFGTTDPHVLYFTTDSGRTWQPHDTFDGPTPPGLCGMFVRDDSSIYAVGRVRGPACFVKTTDGGATWSAQDMNALAAGLIDVYFFDADTGIAAGLTHADHEQSRGIILMTVDGGETWRQQFVTTRTGEWCWKISFPTRRTGYVSLQRNSQTPIYFLKTDDGGQTWQELLFSTSYYFVQGIGFVTPQKGWIGGNSAFPTYMTEDGGATWRSADFGARVNRFRFLSDTLGYAVGRTVYKYTATPPAGVAARATAAPGSFQLLQNHPNPFHPATVITYTLLQPAPVQLIIRDLQGRIVQELAAGTQAAGTHVLSWEGTDRSGRPVSAGTYLLSLRSGDFTLTRKMVLLR